MLKTFFLNSDFANYGEEEFNYIQKFLLQQGILNTNGADYNDFIDLKVTQNGAGNMSVNVATGVAVINTIRNSVSFKVFVANQASANLSVTANALGTNRIDAVILKLSRVTEPDALMSNVSSLAVVPGTGVSALSDGAIQTAIGANFDFIRLANLTVSNGDTSILTADIADTRIRCYSTDASVPNPTIIKFRQLSADPTTPNEGEMWYNTTANILRYYDGATVINIQASTYTGGNGINVTAGVVSAVAGAGIIVNGSGIAVDSGTSANKIVKLDASACLPAVSARNLTEVLFALTPSANIKLTADTERTNTSSGYVKVKEFLVNYTGTVRVYTDAVKSNVNAMTLYWYKNDAGLSSVTLTTSYANYYYDFPVIKGDRVQIYTGGNSNGSVSIKNTKLAYDKVYYAENAVNQD